MKINLKAITVGVMITLLLLFIKNAYSHVLSKQLDAGLARIIEEGGVDNLYIGSSMFRQGININVLNEQEENSFVLCYNGNQPAGELLQLEYLIENGCEMEQIFVDMYAYSAVEEPWLDDSRLLYDSDLEFKLKYFKLLMQNENMSADTAWEMFVTSNNEQFLFWPIHRVLTEDRYDNGGSMSQMDGASDGVLQSMKLPYPNGKELNVDQQEAIVGIVELCKEHDIKLTFVETPKYQRVHEDERYLSIMKEYILLLEDLGVESYVLDDTAVYMDVIELRSTKVYTFDNENAEYYQDLIHLSTEGNRIFTTIWRDMDHYGRCNHNLTQNCFEC